MPALRHLWIEPRARLRRVEPQPDGRFRVQVDVEGLVCGLCALRARSGLAVLPGVEQVAFDPRADRFTLRRWLARLAARMTPPPSA